MLTAELLLTIEREAATAPAIMLRCHAQTIRDLLADSPYEMCEQAIALLIKLDHLEQREALRPRTPAPEEYLAPALIMYSPTVCCAQAA